MRKVLAMLWFVGVIGFCVILVNIEVHSSTIEVIRDGNNLQNRPPCGDICDFLGPFDNLSQKPYPLIEKVVNCKQMIQRMTIRSNDSTPSPPKEPPDELRNNFTQNGHVPIKKYKFTNENVNGEDYKRFFQNSHINGLIRRVQNGISVNPYKDENCVLETIHKYQHQLVNRTGLVIGTRSPWLEATILAFGAHNITTLEYTDVKLDHPQINVYDPYKFAELYLEGRGPGSVDFAASYSSIEHSGLGRYGDPLNPSGDLEAVAQVWCLTNPGGLFFLGVPASKDDSSYILWNANRVYGSERLQHLTTNWIVKEVVRCGTHIGLVLQKPTQ